MKCPRCNGSVVKFYDEEACISCGFVVVEAKRPMPLFGSRQPMLVPNTGRTYAHYVPEEGN